MFARGCYQAEYWVLSLHYSSFAYSLLFLPLRCYASAGSSDRNVSRGAFLALKYDIWWQQFQWFSWQWFVQISCIRWLFIVWADLLERCSISVPAKINIIYQNAVPAQKYLPERRSAAFRHHYTPVQYIRRWISRKPFQRTTNRKWHMGCQMVMWLMTSKGAVMQYGRLS